MTLKIKICLLYSAALLCTSTVNAGKWQLDKNLSANGTYTNNVEFNNSEKKASFVSQSSVALSSLYQSKSLNFNLNSQSTYATYSHDHNINDDYHSLNSRLSYQLWPNGITVITSVNISNQSQNSSQNALADIVSGDTIQVVSYSGGLEYNIENSDFAVNSNIIYNKLSYEDDIGNSHGVSATLNFTNSDNARTMFWNLDSSYRQKKHNENDSEIIVASAIVGIITDYNFNPFVRYFYEDTKGAIDRNNSVNESNSYGFGVRWRVYPRLTIDVGYNFPLNDNSEDNQQKEYVNTSLNWQPSEKTKLEASYSERFYGDSYRFIFQHKTKRLTNKISYNESIQALTRNNFVPTRVGLYLCPNNSQSINDCVLAEGSTIVPSDDPDTGYSLVPIQEFALEEEDYFTLTKSFSWQSTLALSRTTIGLTAKKEKRENLDLNTVDENSSFIFSIKRRLNIRSSIEMSFRYSVLNFQVDRPQERNDKYNRYQLSWQRSLNNSLNFTADISYLDRNSSTVFFQYDETRISATISKGF